MDTTPTTEATIEVSPRERLASLSDTELAELLDYASVGASLVAFGSPLPNPSWGEHTSNEDTCPSCRARRMFDRLQDGEFGPLE